MTTRVLLYPVSFRFESDAPAEIVTMVDPGGEPASMPLDGDPAACATAFWAQIIEKVVPPGASSKARMALVEALDNAVMPVGVDPAGNALFTVGIPVPLAEADLDILQGGDWGWESLAICTESGKPAKTPQQKSGANAQVLDFWRQAFEETDAALDFVPQFLTLWQLRRMYDAIWGYPQDSSGFKRWAVDRDGAFATLLEKLESDKAVEAGFEDELEAIGGAAVGLAAGRALAVGVGAVAGGLAFPAVAVPLAVSAAVAANRLHRKHGRPPTWYRKTRKWKRGPNWIANVYPPRPNWTIWSV